LDQLSAFQISEWEAVDRIDPIGTWREDFREAKLEAMLVNIVSRLYAKKGHTPEMVNPIDFMPDWTGDRVNVLKQQSMEDIKRTMLAIAKVQNKKVVAQKKHDEPPTKLKKK